MAKQKDRTSAWILASDCESESYLGISIIHQIYSDFLHIALAPCNAERRVVVALRRERGEGRA